jgi:hypothetical protein
MKLYTVPQIKLELTPQELKLAYLIELVKNTFEQRPAPVHPDDSCSKRSIRARE